MTAPLPSPPLGASTVRSPGTLRDRTSKPPDARELRGLALTALVVAVAHLTKLGERLHAELLPAAATTDASHAGSLAVVVALFMPWLLGLGVVSVLFGARWLPRATQRLLEPSLIAAWVSVAIGAGLAWIAGRVGLWPWTWASTAPETATLLARFARGDQWVAVGAWITATCLLVPLLSELLFRLALLEWLLTRGVGAARAVATTAVAFGAMWLIAGWSASPDAAVRHALVALLAGIALGVTALRGKRGRGLGFCVLAHGAWMATEHWMLLRALLTP